MANNVKERITQLVFEDNGKLSRLFQGEVIKSFMIDTDDQLIITLESGKSFLIWADYDGYMNLEETNHV